MKVFKRTVIASLILGAMSVAGLSVASDEAHKLIEVKAIKHKNVQVMVEDNGEQNVILISDEEMNDEYLLEQKLSQLDDETRETVLQAIEGTRHMFVHSGLDMSEDGTKHKKVFVVNGGEGHVVHTDTSVDMAYEYDFETIEDAEGKTVLKRQIVIGGDSNKVLKGHTDAIVKLIERGEFTQDELDKIQLAIDVKR